MEPITVSKTAEIGLCTSCGICKSVCPRSCIQWKRQDGLYFPLIDTEQCISCGLCARVCPGLGHSYETQNDAVSTITGNVLSCYNAWSLDPDLRHISASGGVISTMVKELLTAGLYDSVFCVDTYDYREQLITKRYTRDDYLKQNTTPKSRYLPVSHEQTIRYMKENKNERIILIATSCALRGIAASIRKCNLHRDNYLLIGLFCDKIFNYNVLTYFENQYCAGETLSALHFKNKESGGWPGDMKLFPKGKSSFYVSIHERAKAKAYFMPERCLYCVDKLNVFADISTGDNYTATHTSKLGSNSVILRTARGQEAWNAVRKHIEAHPIDISAIQEAQYLDGRLNNLYFGDLRSSRLGEDHDLNRGVPRTQDCADFRQAWESNLRKLRTGQVYDNTPQKLHRQLRRDSKKPNRVVSFCKRGFYFLKRKLNRGNL